MSARNLAGVSPADISGVREHPGGRAVVVFETFHVIIPANFGVDQTRRAECAQAEGAAREQRKPARWILLKNPEAHTAQAGRALRRALRKKSGELQNAPDVADPAR